MLFQRHKSTLLACLLALSQQLVMADRIHLDQPANTTTIYPGCPINISYRVQYSDMAMIRWVQLQLLDQTNTILVERLDNTTRAEWGDVRGKDIVWTVPSELAPGDYILRAFGNASYPCTENGRRVLCDLPLQDRETLHLLPLSASQGCPTVTATPQSGPKLTTVGGQNDTVKENSENTTTSKDTSSSVDSATDLHRIQDQTRMQDQTIRKMLTEARDVNVVNNTITLTNGTVLDIGALMDNATTTRFLAALESSNPTHVNSTTALLEMLHQNASLISIPPSTTNPTNNGTEVADQKFALGTNATEPQQDLNQIQDKTKESISKTSGGPTTAEAMTRTMLGALVGFSTLMMPSLLV
ncbi:hypothetical protein BGZ94_008525 [Podila epigama]|nr:hypothetical protein BGZ94_008525 [Podila epigama]